jgi:hypothetical protein
MKTLICCWRWHLFMSQLMKKTKHFIVKILLVIVLVVQASIWFSTQSHAQSEASISFTDTQLAQRQQKKIKRTPKNIDYELIIKDIVDIFRASNSPGTGTAILSEISGSPGDCSTERCNVELTDKPGNALSGLRSSKYISSIEFSTFFDESNVISTNPNNNTSRKNLERIGHISIGFKDSYRQIFSPTRFHSMMTGEKQPMLRLRDLECNSLSPPCDFLEGVYASRIQEKYFPEPYRNQFHVVTTFAKHKTGKEYLFEVALLGHVD